MYPVPLSPRPVEPAALGWGREWWRREPTEPNQIAGPAWKEILKGFSGAGGKAMPHPLLTPAIYTVEITCTYVSRLGPAKFAAIEEWNHKLIAFIDFPPLLPLDE